MQVSEKRKNQTKELVKAFSKWVKAPETGLGQLTLDAKTKAEIFKTLTTEAKTQNDIFTIEIEEKIIEVGIIQGTWSMGWRTKL